MVELGRHGTRGELGFSADNDIVPGFGEGEVPGFGNGGGRFGGRRGSGSGLIANGEGRPIGTSISSAAAVDGQEPHGRQKADDWAYL